MEQVALSGGQSGSECVEYSLSDDSNIYAFCPIFVVIKTN